MPARRPTQRRPPLSAPRGQLRAAYRIAGGMSPAKLARVEAVAEREIDALLAQPDFQELLAALAEMAELPEEERLRQLEQMAWCVLEMALADSDWRAAAFIADQMRRGCHPARSLAQSVIDAQARALAADPAKPVRPRRARPYDPSTPPSAAPPPACARSSASRRPTPICRSRRQPNPARRRPRASSPPSPAAPTP